MGRDRFSEEIISAVDEIFPGFQKLVEQKQMSQIAAPQTLEEERKRRRLLHQQALRIRRLQLEACGQLVLPIYGSGITKKLAQSEISSLPFKGMDVTRKA